MPGSVAVHDGGKDAIDVQGIEFCQDLVHRGGLHDRHCPMTTASVPRKGYLVACLNTGECVVGSRGE